MTEVTGAVRDVALDGLDGEVTFWSEFRPTGNEVIASARTTYQIVEGQIESGVDLAPGPAWMKLDLGVDAYKTVPVVVPDEGPITLRDLLNQQYEWTPHIVADVEQFLLDAQEARDRAEQHANDARLSSDAAAASEGRAAESESAAATSAGKASASAGESSESAREAREDADRADTRAGDAEAARAASVAAQGLAEEAQSAAEVARSGAETARTGAETARREAEDALDGVNSAVSEFDDQYAADIGRFEGVRDDIKATVPVVEDAADRANTSALQAAQSKEQAEAAQGGAETARDESVAAAGASERARGAAETAATSAGGSATAAAGYADAAELSRGQASDERVIAEAAAEEAQGYAGEASSDADRAEDAAATAASYRWVPRGEWVEGSYVAGDIVIFNEQAYYTSADTSVAPPNSPWVPLTPASGGAPHWSDIDGRPDVYPPSSHTHDAGDVSGEATALLDVSDASVGFVHEGDPYSMSVAEVGETVMGVSSAVGEAQDELDGKADKAHTHPVGDIDAPGTPAAGTFLSGTGWSTPPDTTYPVLSEADATAGTGTDARTVTAAGLKGAIQRWTTGAWGTAVTTIGRALLRAETAADARSAIGAGTSNLALGTTASTAKAGNWTPDAGQVRAGAFGPGIDGTALTATGNYGGEPDTATLAEWAYRVQELQATKAGAGHTHARTDAPVTWYWSGTSMPTDAAQVDENARVGDFIVAPNLSSEPGWHRITEV